MKVVILAGGLGTRLMEETGTRPKPMVEIGGKPIIWHIMKLYEQNGFNEFIICLGYKGHMIKEYFVNYFTYNSNLTIELKNGSMEVHSSNSESFIITLVDTGVTTNTAGRIKRIKDFVKEETFMLTYSDGLADVNLTELLLFHKKSNKLATLTTVQLPGRFGSLEFGEDSIVSYFKEKPEGDGVWINGGFFVLEPGIFDYLENEMDEVQWEKDPLVSIAQDGQLTAFKHYGFWKCMDALRDKVEFESLWASGDAPWKTWK
jgi:glucose-1-phosphate cytidylyltransferase